MPRTISVAESKLSEKLRDAGFVHVTGLPWRDQINDTDGTISASESQYGQWNYNNGMLVVVIERGEVWLRSGYLQTPPAFLREAAPNGKGAHVPCSNGEEIPMRPLMGRVSDPYEDFQGMFPPEPQPKQ